MPLYSAHQGIYTPPKSTWDPKRSPLKRTVVRKGPSVRFHVSLAESSLREHEVGVLFSGHPGPPNDGHLSRCFYRLEGVLHAGVLARIALLFGVYIRAPDFWKVPYTTYYTRYIIYHILHAI